MNFTNPKIFLKQREREIKRERKYECVTNKHMIFNIYDIKPQLNLAQH